MIKYFEEESEDNLVITVNDWLKYVLNDGINKPAYTVVGSQFGVKQTQLHRLKFFCYLTLDIVA